MIGTRLKLIRQSNALSLQELADYISDDENRFSKATLSHYELGISEPSRKTLEIIARKLGTTLDFFSGKEWPDCSITFYSDVIANNKYQLAIESYVQIELEQHLYIEEIARYKQPTPKTKPLRLEGNIELIERLACNFRKDNGIGDSPIPSVCSMLESNGWHIIELPEFMGNICLSGIENSKKARFILHPTLFVLDDYRVALLKAVGDSLVQGCDDQNIKKYCTERFSRCVLFPDYLVRSEFGDKRDQVSIYELSIMKKKYGIPKRAIMLRLKELGIISADYYDSFEDLMRLHGFPKKKMILSETLSFNENPSRQVMMTMNALSKKLISQDLADRILPPRA